MRSSLSITTMIIDLIASQVIVDVILNSPICTYKKFLIKEAFLLSKLVRMYHVTGQPMPIKKEIQSAHVPGMEIFESHMHWTGLSPQVSLFFGIGFSICLRRVVQSELFRLGRVAILRVHRPILQSKFVGTSLNLAHPQLFIL